MFCNHSRCLGFFSFFFFFLLLLSRYNKFVFASFNIINYNVLSSETDSELYGTEPWTYYFKNGVLNFNIAFGLALLALPVALIFPVAPKGGVLYVCS